LFGRGRAAVFQLGDARGWLRHAGGDCDERAGGAGVIGFVAAARGGEGLRACLGAPTLRRAIGIIRLSSPVRCGCRWATDYVDWKFVVRSPLGPLPPFRFTAPLIRRRSSRAEKLLKSNSFGPASELQAAGGAEPLQGAVVVYSGSSKLELGFGSGTAKGVFPDRFAHFCLPRRIAANPQVEV